MARQIGTLKVQGTVGNVTFAQTKDGSIVKRKSSLTRRKILTNAAFAKTRQINAEFTTAAKAGKILREAVKPLMVMKDSNLPSRLVKEFWKVLASDTTGELGTHIVSRGNVALLEHFNYNSKSSFSSIVSVPSEVMMNRATGELSISFSAFIPVQSLTAPAGATHFNIVSAAVEINFDEQTFVCDTNETGSLSYNTMTTGVITLVNTVSANSVNPLFLVVGIRFYNEINGVQYLLKDAMYNPLTIVKVSVE
ncbi:MAG: hypothetical protein ACM3VS_09215 [Candidatus Dadabacteria bacterium]